MNNFSIIGRNTKDVEVLKSKGGKAYIKGSIAVDNPFKEEGVDFFNYIAFSKTAEIIHKYAGKKGDQLGLNGRVEITPYKNKNGETRSWVEIVVNNVTLVGSKKDSEELPF